MNQITGERKKKKRIKRDKHQLKGKNRQAEGNIALLLVKENTHRKYSGEQQNKHFSHSRYILKPRTGTGRVK